MARRPRSLALTFSDAATADDPILRTEVLLALIEAGIEKKDVDGIEAPYKTEYFVVMKNYSMRQANIGKVIKIRETNVTLRHQNPNPNYKTKTRLRIYNYPIDEEIDNLEKVLEFHGSFRKGSIKELTDMACDIKNGAKEVYIEIKKPIPSYMYVGRIRVRFDYVGQRATCRKCYQTGHIAKQCTSLVTCKGCGANDHHVRTCDKVICFSCGKQGHTSTHCFSYEEDFPDMNTEDKDEEPQPEKTEPTPNEKTQETKAPKEKDQTPETNKETPKETEEAEVQKEGNTGNAKDSMDANEVPVPKGKEGQTSSEEDMDTTKEGERDGKERPPKTRKTELPVIVIESAPSQSQSQSQSDSSDSEHLDTGKNEKKKEQQGKRKRKTKRLKKKRPR